MKEDTTVRRREKAVFPTKTPFLLPARRILPYKEYKLPHLQGSRLLPWLSWLGQSQCFPQTARLAPWKQLTPGIYNQRGSQTWTEKLHFTNLSLKFNMSIMNRQQTTILLAVPWLCTKRNQILLYHITIVEDTSKYHLHSSLLWTAARLCYWKC